MKPVHRRALLAAALALPGATQARGQTTPACGPASPPQTLGPYWLANVPARSTLRGPDLPGTPFLLAGHLLDAACRPLAGARIDLWHCDDQGQYDRRGARGRGALRTAADGAFAFETIRPALYPGRTRHFHLRIEAEGAPSLATQLYFPDEPGNARDSLFDRRLLMAVRRLDAGFAGRFDIVLAAA